MTYESSEQSAAAGRPIEGYDIAMGVTHWRITPNSQDIEILLYNYESAPCKRSAVEQTGEIPKDGVDIELPRGHALGMICTAGAPDEEITLTVYRGHDPFYVIYFRGFLTSSKFNSNGIPILRFEPRSSDMPYIGGRRRCMRLCGHKLYGYWCGLNSEDYKIAGTIDTISGLTITASEFGAVATPEPAVYGDLTGLPGCTYIASSSLDSTHIPDKVFNDSYSSWWESATDVPQWIYCKWTSAQKIKKIRVRPQYLHSISTYSIRYFRVAGSNNGSSWTDIDVTAFYGDCQLYTGEGGQDTQILQFNDYSRWISITLDNDTSYTYYRLYIFDNWGGTVVFCNEIEMIEADKSMDVYRFGAGGEIIVGNARRTITSHYGDTITINRPFGSTVVAGSSFYAYAGCNHTPNACRSAFDNILNYGGQEYLPVKNPYSVQNAII